ncbi:MAG TPA: chemotaxis protein CheB [Chitinophagaceae bacterium]|jgi:two-component system chemotaxis response regulator CheB|nr:chemotaxis protein CheB [Chitinophagaceae bacterium]
MDQPKFIVVVGASAGGLTALCEFVAQLDPDLDAAYFIVLHLSRRAISSYLVHRFTECARVRCVLAKDNTPIQKGTVYVAQPGLHLLVRKDQMVLGTGPEENRWRPSIDVLFRSAAATYNGHTIGIVLTGLLNDGTTGMSAIKRSGGTSIVQDPNEAEYPDMPLSVLNNLEVDYCVSLSEMGRVLREIVEQKEVQHTIVPQDLLIESGIAERMATGMDKTEKLGDLSPLTCPDCGGVLHEVKYDAIPRFKCHTGHSYSEDDLNHRQTENIESTLWIALRMMEERRFLLLKLATQNQQKGFVKSAAESSERAGQLEHHINNLKEMLRINERHTA